MLTRHHLHCHRLLVQARGGSGVEYRAAMRLRPRISYGTKLALGAVLLVVAVGAVVLLLIDRALRSDLMNDLDARLESHAQGAAVWAAQGQHPERLAIRLSGIVGARVTILDVGGRVIGDSVEASSLGKDEAKQTEVVEALHGRVGHATRISADGVETRYVAIPAAEGLVLRLGTSLATIHATVYRVRTRLAVASGLGILVAIGLSYVASRLAARPLGAMRDAAQRIAGGDYSVSLGGQSPDEFGALERSLSVLAARLDEDRKRIERLEATRRDFVANVSHELRTPVTAIQGYAETLLRGAPDAETAKRFLDTMHRQAKRISALVTDLLRLSEIEARDREVAKPGPVRLADVVSEGVALVRENYERRTDIRVEVPQDLIVHGDAASLEQIVSNLVENAVRYGVPRESPNGAPAEVSVLARRVNDRVEVVVRDSGPGIAPEHLPRLFERFYRVDPSQSKVAGGTGLGLAIVKHLTESMGGSVRVESELGSGSSFTVELGGAKQ
jgi:signal transduction histidine kinase